jgi:hypothetical protein
MIGVTSANTKGLPTDKVALVPVTLTKEDAVPTIY